MRHLIISTFCFLVSVLSLAQNQNLQQVVLTDGTIIKGQVEKQIDGTIMVSTTNGDIFFFQSSEVNRIVGMNQAFTEESQSGVFDSTVKRKGNKLCFASSGIALTKENYSTREDWEAYQLVVDKGKTGRILLYSGLGSFVLGGAGIYIMLESGWWPSGLVVASGVLAAAGLGAGISGLAMTISCNKKLDKLADSYYWNSGIQLSLGVQQHGIGLALKF